MKYYALATASIIAGTSALTNSIEDEANKWEEYRADNFALRKHCNSFKYVERGNIQSCTGYGLAGYAPGVPLDNSQLQVLWESYELSRGTNGLCRIGSKLSEFNRGNPIWFNWDYWHLFAQDMYDFSSRTGFKYYTGFDFELGDGLDIIRQAADKPGDNWVQLAAENWQYGTELLGDNANNYRRFKNTISQLDYKLGRALTLRETKFDDSKYSLNALANMFACQPADDALFVDPNEESSESSETSLTKFDGIYPVG